MTDFLLELRSEEIPARMQAKARDDLARLFTAELAKAGIATGELVTYATPRRLALIARDLPVETAAVSEEVKGPKASAPPQALEGFLRKTGLTREQLTERDGVLFAVTEKPGRATAAVLAEAIPAIVRGFPWPKSMRWGDASTTTESLKWVRPLQGIVALFGEMIVPFEIAGIESGAATLGHRFHHAGPITLGGAHDYVDKLRMAHVLVDQDERATLIRDRAREAAAQAGLELVEDEGLVAENAGLTEWPVPLLGQFDPAFLDVPPEVIQLTARVNQKYFVCRAGDGSLANAFVCTANIDAADGGAKIVEGNRKVLAARLSDAKFFYDTDLKVPLAEQAEKLSKIVFHEKLGTLADKVDRVAKLARWLVEEGIVTQSPSRLREGLGEGVSANDAPSVTSPPPAPPAGGRGALADLADRAARLAKADLVTGMVGEFPELQGLMGGYYAAAQGEDPQVAAAIRDHYKPVGQGDDVPTDSVTVAVSLADKLDTIYNFFETGDVPTGSKDPFALRRQALGVIALITTNLIRCDLRQALFQAGQGRFDQIMDAAVEHRPELKKFIEDGLTGKRAGDEWMDRLKEALAIDVGPARLTLADDGMSEVVRAFRMQDHWPKTAARLLDFFADRLKVQQREAGVRHDLIDAVFALGGEDDLVRLLARVHALQAFVATEDGTNLLAGYKRAANILKKEAAPGSPAKAGAQGPTSDESRESTDLDPRLRGGTEGAGASQIPLSYTPEPAEAALIAALDSAEPRAASSVTAEDFAGAMAALASLRAPIDAFFDSVTVNDPDPVKRTARLALLERVRAAVHNVADFSKVEG
ncbi:glycine--tRNA ligase subunit beta [Sphingomonas ginsenosidivorax]|uniref:Glycine--tRNA ligase beta subunit n=1 Tax=Sphingomonas ginsenosidivorax TaxID=862135 RepID=A0A5C6UA81_9SPHN|nr:glycine--tRNA ligase subunit beta [Sphingomonas ginsenosidivorax]TXC69833.1 glycine--tRNA ligase subunit beta [Sphingomonas ginsenosidivorax]